LFFPLACGKERSRAEQYGSVKAFQVVIPAKVGIQTALLQEETLMDFRLRGNDEIMGLCGPEKTLNRL